MISTNDFVLRSELMKEVARLSDLCEQLHLKSFTIKFDRDAGADAWVRVHHDGAKRYYEGVSTEIDLLPTYVEHGSRAVCLDTSEIYTFHGKLKKWFKL